ncbi:MAG: RNA methyltransferase [Lachnospiraceae bacterium]|nr:RNA methyltransferase [Lachnospiraceae bacterium]
MNRIEVNDLRLPMLDVYAGLSEAELLHYMEPHGGLFIAESPKVIERALNAGCVPVSILAEECHLTGEGREVIDRCGDIPVYTAKTDVIAGLTGFKLTRGMLCAMVRPKLPKPDDICRKATRIAVLENVMNPANVGAIFRSAAALNMDAVLLTHGCSDPLYRRAIRVSMGTVFQIPWTYFPKQESWPEDGMRYLKEQGFVTAAMALCDQSISIEAEALKKEEKLAVILGTEGDGLAGNTMARCDYTVRIPMAHGVDSLNVAAASAVAFWELRSLPEGK